MHGQLPVEAGPQSLTRAGAGRGKQSPESSGEGRARCRHLCGRSRPLELSAIEALLLAGAHHMGRASESNDPFVAAAAARHLFDHDFEPCDEEAPGGKPMRFELPKPQAALARQQPRL